jgi:hypothetical protein
MYSHSLPGALSNWPTDAVHDIIIHTRVNMYRHSTHLSPLDSDLPYDKLSISGVTGMRTFSRSIDRGDHCCRGFISLKYCTIYLHESLGLRMRTFQLEDIATLFDLAVLTGDYMLERSMLADRITPMSKFE